MDAKPSTKAGQRLATMQKLVQIGRSQFARHGYAQTSTEELVHLAGITRGALYHHFGSKEGLFKAVVEDVQRDIGQRIADAVSAVDAPWEQLRLGCQAFLAASLDPEVQRILLIDAPAVLGWEIWRQMDAENAMRLLEGNLRELVEAGLIAVPSVAALTHLLSGAMNEAVLWIARAENAPQALAETIATLDQLLSALRRDQNSA